MSETANLSLPLLDGGQAQKHVTMNEALARMDALTSTSVASASLSTPPGSAFDGDAYIVASTATGDWAGRDNEVAFWLNGGWDFAPPRPGWRVWVEDRNAAAVWSGSEWVVALTGPVADGARLQAGLIVGDETVPAGGAFQTAMEIPDRAVVLGVTARVIEAISGPPTWRLGVSGSDDRYGSGIGSAQGSSVNGVTSTPVAYFADTPLLVTPVGTSFAGGSIRLAVHYFLLSPPDPI